LETLIDTTKGKLKKVVMALATVELLQQVEKKPYKETHA
jgi:hypothetical protein